MTPLPVVATAAVIGSVVASYATTATLRATTDDAPNGARSLCDGCRRPLAWRESLPIISFTVLRGRCRTCAAPIPLAHPAGEALGLVAGGSIALAAPDYRAALLALMAATLLAASVADVRIRILPHSMVAVVALTATALAAVHGLAVWIEGVVAAAVSFAVLAGVAFDFERRRGRVGLGFGDVKLFAAFALWLGAQTPWMWLIVALLGGVVMRAKPGPDRTIPLGPIIALAGFVIGLLLEAGLWPRL